jgi:hypothetical protein
MKQTAVEWLQSEIDNKDMGEIPMWIYEFIEQAKEMEKEQIIDFGYDIADDLAWGKYRDKKHMEERYNEFLTYREEDDDI